MPVVFHCGTSVFPGAVNRYADPALVDEVAGAFPDLKIVLAHGGRGWWYDAAAFITQMRANVWIELGGLPPKKLPQYYRNFDLGRLGRKFIFATDWPGIPGIARNAAAVADLGFDRDTPGADLLAQRLRRLRPGAAAGDWVLRRSGVGSPSERSGMRPGRDAPPNMTDYEAERAGFRLDVPERFNFVLDVLERRAKATPDGLALLALDAAGAETARYTLGRDGPGDAGGWATPSPASA